MGLVLSKADTRELIGRVRSWPRLPWLLCLLLISATVIAYQPAWDGGFVWDDDQYVVNNKLLSVPDGLRRIWFSLDSPSQYFPLVYTTFRWERALWGLNTTGYHWVNILLHAANALLVWRLLRRLGISGAWLAAALFALHPVHVESVAWITERKNVLSLFFSLLSLLAWVEFIAGRPWRWYGLCLACFALALSSKSTACMLPVALLLILWLERKPITRLRIAQLIPFLLLALGMGLLAMWWERYHNQTRGEAFGLGPLERVLIAGRAVWFYLAKLVWPTRLAFSYPRWSISSRDPLAYGWLAAEIALGVAIWRLRRSAGRGLEVAALFFVATLAPLLGFIMLYTFRYSFVADHYQYVASIGPLALGAAWLTAGLNRFAQRAPLLQPAVCVALLFLLGALTWRQAGAYASIETLWRATLASNPRSALAHTNLGPLLEKKGRLDEAIGHYEEALKIDPDFHEAHANLGMALARKGRFQEAFIHEGKAVQLDPQSIEARNNLGLLFLQAGRVQEAVQQFRKVLELAPDNVATRNNLANVLLRSGRPDEAISELREAIRLDANVAALHFSLANALVQKGQTDEAIFQYQKALDLDPNLVSAHYNLGVVLLQNARTEPGLTQLRKAIELAPDAVDAHLALAEYCERTGKLEEAVVHYTSVLRFKPDQLQALNSLAWIRATVPQPALRNGPEAVQLAERACQLTAYKQAVTVSTLAAAYAESGHFDVAVKIAERARELAAAAGQKEIAEKDQQLLDLFRAGKPYREVGR